MIVYAFFTVALVACIACCGYLAGKVNRMEINMLDDVANLANEIALQRKRLEEYGQRLRELDDRTEDMDSEAKIAEALEKKWDETIQNIVNYNPMKGNNGV